MNGETNNIRLALARGPNSFYLHSNADLDCVGSAAALSLYFNNATIIAPCGISHLGKRLLENLNIQAEGQLINPEGTQPVVLDAQDDSSIGYTGIDWTRAIVIDHHRNSGRCKAPVAIIDETAASCCELVWDNIGRPEKVDRNVGMSLMAGLIADTGHLKRGGWKTLVAASEILKASGLSLEDIQTAFESAEDQDMSRRISRLKGAQRMKFDRTGEWIVAVTETGAFESAACHALLSLGADVAFAASQKDEEFRITGRANRLATNAGIHLGDILNRIACECGGEGGGHDGAAGISGHGDAEAFLGICSQSAISTLKGKTRANIPE